MKKLTPVFVVEDIEPCLDFWVKRIDLVVPKRTTFYGATEVGVREPGGNLIVFAMQGQEEGADE